MGYKLKLDMFEGPLDLLLYLIKKDDIDITNIPIVEVTEQYMEYIDMMKMLDLDIVGDFLVMAATLMQIKSKMLLPPDPEEVEQEEEDPRDELVRRLQEYQKFKEIADQLKIKESERQDYFQRRIDPETTRELIEESKEVYFEASLFDLITALTSALKRTPEEIVHEIIKEEFTVEQKIHDILHLLLEQSTVELADMFGKTRSKDEIIVTFIAILELIRLKEIIAVQKRHLESILIMRNKENVAPAANVNEEVSSQTAEPNQTDRENDGREEENSI